MGTSLELMSEHNLESNERHWDELAVIQDDSQLAGPHEEQESTLVQVTPSMMQNKKSRTKNFNEKEDIMLVSAWLQTSMDPVQVNEQSRATYWQRLYDYYHKNKDFESTRNCNSLMHRWSTIQDSVNRFCECYSQIENMRQSELTDGDKIVQACELYKSKDKNNKSFSMLHCWSVLEHEQKWMNRCSQKRQKTSINASPGRHDDDGEGLTSEVTGRQGEGKKVEKGRQHRHRISLSPGHNLCMEVLEKCWAKKQEAEALKELKEKKEHNVERFALEKERIAIKNKRFALEKEMIAIEKEMLELKERDLELRRRLEDDRVMSMDFSTMNGPEVKYYLSLRDEIVARRLGAGSS